MPHILSSIYVSSPSFKMGFGQAHDKVSGGWQPLVAFLGPQATSPPKPFRESSNLLKNEWLRRSFNKDKLCTISHNLMGGRANPHV